MDTNITFEESVRIRPGMYVGRLNGKGIVNLINGVLCECVELIDGTSSFIHFSVNNGRYSLTINTIADLKQIKEETCGDTFHHYLNLKVLRALSSRLWLMSAESTSYFERGKLHDTVFIEKDAGADLQIVFELDEGIFGQTRADYLQLYERLQFLAMLNPGLKLLLKDTSNEYPDQNYFCFPQGIEYVFDRLKQDVLGEIILSISENNFVEDRHYHINIAYRSDWYKEPTIMAIVNDITIQKEDSFIKGIVGGISAACKEYIAASNLEHFKLSKKKLHNGLIVAARIKGKTLECEGPYKECGLSSKAIENECRRLVQRLFLSELYGSQEVADRFLKRFDEKSMFP